MSKAKVIKTNFTGGELSPLMFGRVDTVKYQNGAARLQNMLVRQQGGAWKREGSRFIGAVKTSTKKTTAKPATKTSTKKSTAKTATKTSTKKTTTKTPTKKTTTKTSAKKTTAKKPVKTTKVSSTTTVDSTGVVTVLPKSST